MITLYELHWSHYCEKVRLALDYMQLPWRAVGIDAFRKEPLRSRPRPTQLPSYTVPAIVDESTGAYVMDSTPILRYLAENYPQAPQLFPGDAAQRAEVDALLLALDSQLGILARRFAYTQVILECPTFLPELFLRHRVHGLYCAPGIRHVSGAFMGMVLTQRFEFHRSEELGLYEALEQYLLGLAAALEQREFVVGNVFSAADLALAALLRPLTIVPFFAEHEGLRSLFDRHRRTLAAHGGAAELAYQVAIRQARTQRPPVRRKLRQRATAVPFVPHQGSAANDQQRLWNRQTLTMPLHYALTLRRNKVRHQAATDQIR
jgi:glutathione S-transferase